ncbi:MAG: hypothetical protein OEV92_04925 [Nitrospinota bacterium]|nr:hypothetical protein [Nitrospinota bacterium]
MKAKAKLVFNKETIQQGPLQYCQFEASLFFDQERYPVRYNSPYGTPSKISGKCTERYWLFIDRLLEKEDYICVFLSGDIVMTGLINHLYNYRYLHKNKNIFGPRTRFGIPEYIFSHASWSESNDVYLDYKFMLLHCNKPFLRYLYEKHWFPESLEDLFQIVVLDSEDDRRNLRSWARMAYGIRKDMNLIKRSKYVIDNRRCGFHFLIMSDKNKVIDDMSKRLPRQYNILGMDYMAAGN